MLLGKEVFGDTFLACGFCGYNSKDNSNVRKHYKRRRCVQNRGSTGSDLMNQSTCNNHRAYATRLHNVSALVVYSLECYIIIITIWL